MSRFKLDYRLLNLKLSQPFGISRGVKTEVANVLVRLQADGIEGFGEAAPNNRYDEDEDHVIQFLEALPEVFFDEVHSAQELSSKLDRQKTRHIQSAKAAVEMAWLDWQGKHQGMPLWKLWNAPSDTGPVTSYTIGLDEIEVMQQKVDAAAEYPILKVKLGTSKDREIIRGIREVTDKPIRADANEGWSSLEEAKSHITFLAEQNIELVEQPMPASCLNEMAELKAYSPLPLCADESFTGSESLEEIAKTFDAINIKLMKTGSLIKVRRIIGEAKELDLNIMIGCMIESSLANTAGALLALWADYADLDGHLLIKDDPFEGLSLNERKQVFLNKRPGLGALVKNSPFE